MNAINHMEFFHRMATSLSQFERATARPGGEHLLVNPFGDAKLFYGHTLVGESGHPTDVPVGTPDFNYLAFTNQNGSFDMQRRDSTPPAPWQIIVELGGNRVAQLQVTSDGISITPNYRVRDGSITMEGQIRPIRPNALHFRLVLLRPSHIHRVDLRYRSNAWFSVFLTEPGIMSVHTHGNEYSEMLEQFGNRLNASVRSGNSMGLTAPTFRRTLNRSQASSRTASPTMPALVTRTQALDAPSTSQAVANQNEPVPNTNQSMVIPSESMTSTSGILTTQNTAPSVKDESDENDDEPNDVMLVGRESEMQTDDDEQWVRRIAMQVAEKVVKRLKYKSKTDE